MKTVKHPRLILPDNNTPPDVSKRISRLAWLLDESIRLPGGFRIGWDGIIGLIPGLGDVMGLAASSYILYLASKGGAGKVVLLRMAVNILLETGIGSIPVIGDLFDFVFKANSRNLRLLQRHAAAPGRARRVSGIWLMLFLLLTLSVMAGVTVLVVKFIQWSLTVGF